MNMTRVDNLRCIISVLISLLVCIGFGGGIEAQTSEPDNENETAQGLYNPEQGGTVVATVDGTPIYQQEIEVSPAMIKISFMERDPGEDEIRKFIARKELSMLKAKIKEKIRENIIQELDISVTEDEVENAVDSRFEQAGIDEKKALQIAEWYRIKIEALKEWQKDKSRSDEIYREYFEGWKGNWEFTRKQWQVFIESNPTENDLERLKSMSPEGLDDIRETTIQSVKREMLYEKLIEQISANLRVSKDEIYHLYAERYSGITEKPAYSEVREKLREEIKNRKKQRVMLEWWQARFIETDIQIKDERLKELWRKKPFIPVPREPAPDEMKGEKPDIQYRPRSQ